MRARIVVCVALVTALCAVPVPEGLAEETTCRGTIKGKTLDNVKVPQGARCTLQGTKVKGTIKVDNDARLEAIDVNVIGNVQAEGARNVIIRKTSKVDGSVQIVQGKKARVRNSKVIDGNLQCKGNHPAPNGGNNEVGGDKEDQCSSL